MNKPEVTQLSKNKNNRSHSDYFSGSIIICLTRAKWRNMAENVRTFYFVAP
jgi:hypothetical protein